MTIGLYILLGVVAGAVVLAYTRRQKPEHEFRLLALGLAIAAVIYVGLGFVWGNASWVGIEAAGVLFYTAFIWLAYRKNIVWLAVGWFLHTGWDVALHLFGPGEHIVPAWYAFACIGYDVLMAGYIYVRREHWQKRSFE